VRHKKKLLVPALAGVLAVFGLSASGAMADSGTAVAQLTGFRQVVVDDVGGNNYLFLSGSNGIVVTDPSGNTITTLDSGANVAGLAVSADGNTVYAALASDGNNADSIDAIDVPTITSSGATENYYQLGNGDVPGSLAFQSGELWVSYTDSSGQAGIGSLDPTSGTFTAAPADDWTTAPDLAADPQDGGTLVAVQPGSDAVAATYDTTTNGTLPSPTAQTTLGQCSDETQLAVVPGGTGFVAACGSSVNEYSVSSLAAPQSSYAVGSAAPAGAAIDADGTVTVGSSSGIYVYGSGSGGALENVFDLSSPASLASGGLAWEDAGAAGPQLVAVVDSGGNYSVQVFSQPTVTQSSLSLDQPSTAVIGDVPLSGSLTLSTGAALPQGTDVTITSTAPGGSTTTLPPVPVGADGSFTTTDTTPTQAGDYTYTATYISSGSSSIASASASITVPVTTTTVSLSGPAQADVAKPVQLTGTVTLPGGAVSASTKIAITRTFSGKTTSLPSATVSANGSFPVTDTPTAAGTYTYTASYPGTQTIPAATGSFTLSVVLMTPALSLTTGTTTVNYRTTIHVTAHLGTTYTNRTVSIYEQWDGFRGKRLLKTGRVNSSGELTVSYKAPHSVTFSAVFAGDAYYAARTVDDGVAIRAATTMSMGGFYGTRKIGSAAYRLYHHSARIYLTVSVGPGKPGECVKIEVQEHYNGAWHANEMTGCSALNASSQLYGSLTVSNGDRGYYYRVRADYIRSARDISNVSSDSGWQYVMPES
jgi:hypothetical protein